MVSKMLILCHKTLSGAQAKDQLGKCDGRKNSRCEAMCADTRRVYTISSTGELLREEYSQEEVARISSRDSRTIRRWIKDFNESGIDGVALKGRAVEGRERLMLRSFRLSMYR